MYRNKFHYVMMVLVVVSMLLASCAPQATPAPTSPPEQPAATQPPAQADKPFAGESLKVLNTEAVPVLGYMHRYLDPKYEEYSGVKIIYESIPHGDVFTKIQTMAAAKSDAYDVFMVDDTLSTALDAIGATVDLTPLWKANPGDIQLTDFPLRTFAVQAMVKGKLVAIPNMGALGVLAYRKDLFNDPNEQAAYKEKYGTELKPPEDWEEYLQIGQFFTRPEEGLYGFNHRYGNPNNIMFDWIIGYYYPRGGTQFDDNFNPTINTPEGLDATKFFLSKEFLAAQPPGAESFTFDNVMQNMVQCKVAMYLTESWAITLLMDTANPCGGQDKIGITVIPGWKDPNTGEIKRASLAAGTGWSINAFSSDKQKAIAWDYIQFTMGNKMMHEFAAEYGYAPLISVFTDPELAKKFPWLPSLYEMSKVCRPRVIEPFELELENALGTELQAVLVGQKTPEEALAKASDEWVRIVAQAGYNDGQHHFLNAERLEQMACDYYASLGLKHQDCK